VIVKTLTLLQKISISVTLYFTVIIVFTLLYTTYSTLNIIVFTLFFDQINEDRMFIFLLSNI